MRGTDRDVIWVPSFWEEVPRSGGGIRSHAMIASLRASGLRVEVCGDGLSGASARVVAATRRWPLASARAWTPRHARHVRALQRRGAVAIADHLAAAVVPQLTARTIVNLHNVDSELVRSSARGSTLLGKVDRALQVRGTRPLEVRVLASRAAVVVVSQRDAELLGRGTVVPNGTRPPHAASPPGEGGPIFVGALDYPPNEDAVRWWVSEVWPLLSRPAPLTVIGRGGGAVLGDIASHPALAVIGEVEDVSPHLLAAGFSVAPLRSGEGSRLKVVESLAHGRAVVSTPKGVEGFPLGQDEGVLVGGTAHELATLVDRLVDDAELRTALGTAALSAAGAYRWDEVTKPFVDLVHQAVAT